MTLERTVTNDLPVMDSTAVGEIHGKPVTYATPDPSGRMPVSDASFDLIVGFSVLHHVPNVSTVVQEMYRVQAPGGYVLLREHTHSMGDWRYPRRGLTRRERGIPLSIFRQIVAKAGFSVLRETRCMFSLMLRLQRIMHRPIWTMNWLVDIDAWICRLRVWPDHYHARTTLQKVRPTAVAFVLRKQPK